MPEKVIGTDLKPNVCFESRMSFGESGLVNIFVCWLSLGNYFQGYIVEVVSELSKICIKIVRTFIRVFFLFRDSLVYNGHLKVATPGL